MLEARRRKLRWSNPRKGTAMSTPCSHTRETSRYVTTTDDWTGEKQSEWICEVENTTRDIGVGAFQCTQCGEVMYYTGNWKRFYTEGTPCIGSEYSVKTGDATNVRAIIEGQQ